MREGDALTGCHLLFFTQSCQVLEGEMDQLKGKMADITQERTALVEKVKGLQKEVRRTSAHLSTGTSPSTSP